MKKSLSWTETLITAIIKTCGYSAVVFVLLIFFFLLRQGVPALAEVKIGNLFSTRWYPIEDHFGILPLITGSVIVTVIAMLIAIPFGIGTAVFLIGNCADDGCGRSLNHWWNYWEDCHQWCWVSWGSWCWRHFYERS